MIVNLIFDDNKWALLWTLWIMKVYLFIGKNPIYKTRYKYNKNSKNNANKRTFIFTREKKANKIIQLITIYQP